MHRLWQSAVLAAALLSPIVAPRAAFADDDHKPARYHDKKHNDDHEWNEREDRAYERWLQDTHRKHIEFGKLKDRDQQAYWSWRHDHSDALLKIDIH
ncbi:MAG TPA: hypothetical protein VGN17_06010 [Bryobacteraceae bacterium]|jgi:hypothetical protein